MKPSATAIAIASVLVTAAVIVACRDIVGIQPIAYDEAGSSACNGSPPTLVFSSTAAYDALSAQGGFVFAEVTSSGVDRCAIAGCPAPSSVITVGSSVEFIGSTVTPTAIDYTVQGLDADGGTGGEIHSAALDGTGDTIAFATNTKYPAVIGADAARIFWVDDPYSYAAGSGTDALDCFGCTGTTDVPWITQLPGSVYGIVADANDVYILADSASLADLVVLGCSVTTACGASPRSVIAAIDESTTQPQMASDGTFFYIARENHGDVTRVDATGATTQVLTSQDVVAIAVDAAAGNLYYGTSTGVIGRVKSDGSAPPTTLACDQDSIMALAVDAQNVYFLAGSTTSNVFKLPK